jgi:hypothetical protein
MIRRVAINFDWPMGKIWNGFINPHRPYECSKCRGTGSSKEVRRLTNRWYYGNDDGIWNPDQEYTATQYHLTQEEVNLLVDKGRLHDFAATWNGKRWIPKQNDDGSQYYPGAAEVNEAAKKCSSLHDSINQYIVTAHRAKKAGYPIYCDHCENGTGEIFAGEDHKRRYEEWTETEPPKGDGWQVWETVSGGSPVSPVFKTAEELIEYLVEGGDYRDRKNGRQAPSREAVEAFVNGAGWVLSGARVNGKWISNIETAKYQNELIKEETK